MTDEQVFGPVLVGVDGSPEALRAVRVATRHAAARGVELRIVHAAATPSRMLLPRQVVLDPRAVVLLADADAVARLESPAVMISRQAVWGQPAQVLQLEARGACLVVIGHRGGNGRSVHPLGSLGLRLVGRLGCPLLVVHHLGDRSGPVVVGLDDPRTSERVLRTAFAQARLLSRPLSVLHAWRVPVAAAMSTAHGNPPADLAGIDALTAQVRRVGQDFPEVQVSVAARHGREGLLLAGEAEGAALLVLGGPAPDGLRGRLRGSSALAVAKRVACPVLVVPSRGWETE